MVKVAQMDIPTGYQPLLDKILSYFDNQIYPTWASRYFHNTRSAKKANVEKTYIPKVSDVWKTYDAATKALWKSASTFMGYTNYQYFTTKYSYCKKNGLDLSISPDQTKQLYGLQMTNPGGLDNVYCKREDIVLTGPVGVSFKYKKIEKSPPAGDDFRCHLDLYYFKDGDNYIDTYDWTASAGSVDWTAVSFSAGVSGQYYFHSVLTFYLDYYDVDILLDNLLITDNLGDVYREPFTVKSGKSWVWSLLVRKYGWTFFPAFAVPHFQTVWVDS